MILKTVLNIKINTTIFVHLNKTSNFDHHFCPLLLTPTEDVTGLAPVGEEITEILEYQQGELYVKKYVRPEYINPTADGTQAKRVIAALPNMPIAKSFVGASLLAHLMASKYIDHSPIYRQLQMFSRQKIILEDNTVNNWFRQGCNLIEPLYQVTSLPKPII